LPEGGGGPENKQRTQGHHRMLRKERHWGAKRIAESFWVLLGGEVGGGGAKTHTTDLSKGGGKKRKATEKGKSVVTRTEEVSQGIELSWEGEVGRIGLMTETAS